MAKCKNCGDKYTKSEFASSFENWCSVECAIELTKKKGLHQAKLKIAREADKKHKEFKRKVNGADKSKATKKAQAAFNKYIRARDSGNPCISCQRHHSGQIHAGHYKTTGAHPELRFNELNCHAQCAPCNNHLSGNIIEYRKNLLIKIGEENLNWIEGSHQPKKYTVQDLNDIEVYYKQKIKDLL